MPGRGGRGGGGRGRGEMPRANQVSRKVSWLLRHGAEQEGLKLGKGGYVSVADALNTKTLRGLKVTFDELKEVVKENDKQRFSMIPATTEESEISEVVQEQDQTPDFTSDDPKDYLIRANQGHSLKVDTEGLLTPITKEAGNIPSVCVHGTNEAAWQNILKSGGLRRMTRNHIHFASGLPKGFKSLDDNSTTGSETTGKEEANQDAAPVISGMRNSSTVLIYIDIEAAMNAGIQFFVSDNGVILSEGNENGVLLYEFFKRVEGRKVGKVLMRDGVLPEGVVVDVQAWEKEFGGSKRGGKGRGRGGKRAGGSGKAKVVDDSGDLTAGV